MRQWRARARAEGLGKGRRVWSWVGRRTAGFNYFFDPCVAEGSGDDSVGFRDFTGFAGAVRVVWPAGVLTRPLGRPCCGFLCSFRGEEAFPFFALG